MKLARAVAGAMALAALAPLAARAEGEPQNPVALPRKQAAYSWDRDLLRVSFSYREALADPSLVKKLSSGLPMVVAMRAYVYRQGQDTPVALTLRVCRVVYDLWDEVYRVHVSEPEHERDQAAVLDGAVRLCTDARDLPAVRRDLLRGGERYFLGIVVDVNPVSADMLDQMRRWMSRPTGVTRLGPGDALFGGFVQLFVRQVATSDKTLTFRTQELVP